MKFVEFSWADADRWWERTQFAKGFWTTLPDHNFADFALVLMVAPVLVEFSNGIGWVNNLMPGHACRVHGIMWGKDIIREAEDIRSGLCMIGAKFGLRRIECIIPAESHGLNHFLGKRVGMAFEGTLRAYFRTATGFADGNIYSLIGGQNG